MWRHLHALVPTTGPSSWLPGADGHRHPSDVARHGLPANEAWPGSEKARGPPATGVAVLGLDGNGVAVYRRLARGEALAADEVRLRYRSLLPYGDVRYGADSYFFEEGSAEAYQLARYGVLKVDPAGKSVLVGLADAEGRLIQPQ